jgi:Flp pilus assembly protein TadG
MMPVIPRMMPVIPPLRPWRATSPAIPGPPRNPLVSWGGRGEEWGQALIETAITLPVMIVLFLGFLAVGVAVQGAVDMNTAVYLATASAVTAPANSPGTGRGYATDTYTYTIQHFTYLVDNGGSITCAGTWAPNSRVTCTATATVQLTRTFAIVPDLPITATASATVPQYRSGP